MSTRYFCCLAGVLLVLWSGHSFAQDQSGVLEMRRLQTALSVINAELKADLDQVLALHEALKANSRAPLNLQGRSPDPLSYDDVAAAQRLAIQRDVLLNGRLDAILARSAVLDAEKQPLLERVRSLSLLPRTSAASVTLMPQ
jgi:Flp pilus assembly protein TadB